MRLFKKRDMKREFLPSAIEIIETPENPLGNIVIWIITVIVISTILWSVLSKVDKVVAAPGKVVTDGRNKSIQTEKGGVIKNINVKEGEKITKDQVIMTLDSEFYENKKKEFENQLNDYKAKKEGLLALNNGESTNGENNGEALKNNSEKNLYEGKIKEFDLNINKLDKESQENKDKIASNESNINKFNEEKTKLEGDLKKLENDKKQEPDEENQKKIESEINPLVIKISELTSKIKNTTDENTSLNKSIKSIEFELESIKNSKNMYAESFKRTNSESLIDVDKKIEELTRALDEATVEIEKCEIKSSVDGIIQNINVNNTKAVVAPGTVLAQVVSDLEELRVEAIISTKDIGFVKVGQKVEVKFDTFPFQQYGLVEGELMSLSADAVKVNEGVFGYRADIKLSKNSLEVDDAEVEFLPGMTTVSEIVIGQRRIIDFFIPDIKNAKRNFNLR